MNAIFTPFVAVWLLLVVATAALAVYRKMLARGEDDTLHLSPAESRQLAHQVSLEHRLRVVDQSGKLLTLVVVVSGLVLAAIYLDRLWIYQSTHVQWR